MFQVFHLFQTYVANVLSGCFKSRCGVAHVPMAIHTYFKCFIYFRRMLQVFRLDISKVDLRKAHAAAASAPPWVTARLLLLRACGRVKRSGL
jgi:hypothetical protein